MARLSNEEIEQRERNRANFEKTLKENNGGLDFEAMRKGAEAEEQARQERSQLSWKKLEDKTTKTDEALSGLLAKAGESVNDEKERKARQEKEKQQARLQKELDQQIQDEYGVKTDEEQTRDEALRSVLKG